MSLSKPETEESGHWVIKTPNTWKVIPVQEVTMRTGLVNPATRPDWKIKYVDVSSVSNDLLQIKGFTEYIGRDAPSRARKEIRTGDVLFATVRPSLRRIAVVPQDLDHQVCSTAFCVLRANPDLIDPEFLFYAVSNDRFVARVTTHERGISYPAVTDKIILKESIALPPIREQREIAKVLTIVRKAQLAVRDVIEVARHMKKAMMTSFFSNPEWPKTTLGSATKLIMGQSPPSEFYNSNGDGLPFLQGKAEFSEKYPHPTKYCTQRLKVAPKGSVLMSVRAPVGDVNLADREYVIGRGIASLDLKNGNNEFLFYLLSYLKPQVQSLGSGTTFDSVNKGNLEQLEISLPSRQEQERISAMLSAVDKKIEASEVELKQIHTLYQTLLHELLSGRIRLPTKGS